MFESFWVSEVLCHVESLCHAVALENFREDSEQKYAGMWNDVFEPMEGRKMGER